MTVLLSSADVPPRITSFSGLLEALTRLIDGEDTSVSDVSVNTLKQIVNMGERRIYREVRSRHNEKAFSGITVVDNEAPIPPDWEAASIVHFGGKALAPVAEEWLREYLERGATGPAVYFAEAGSSLIFAPSVSDDTEVKGRYYCRLPDLTTENFSSNQLFAAESDLFIYAALAESGPYFGADHMQKIPFWEQKYQAVRDRINTNKQRAAYSAGRMQVRPSTNLMG